MKLTSRFSMWRFIAPAVLTIAVVAGGASSAAASPASGAVLANSGYASASSYTLAPHAISMIHLAPASDPTVAVSPRQGSGNLNGYNGNVEWGQDEDGYYYVDTWGEIWNRTGGTSYVYLAITDSEGNYYNYKAGSAGYGTTEGVNFDAPEMTFPPVEISVTVCTEDNGWSCGPDVYALVPVV
jgi:hypothetical protein